MSKAARALLKFYKRSTSATPHRCIYTPTCSSYMYQSIEKYGVVRGGLKGFFRILRCNPFAKGGFDPVRENYRGKTKWLI